MVAQGKSTAISDSLKNSIRKAAKLSKEFDRIETLCKLDKVIKR